MKNFFLIILFLYSLGLAASDQKWEYSTIPAALLNNANSVYRLYDVDLRILSSKKAVQKVHYARTILKDNAADEALMIVFFDSFSKVRHLRGTVYDKAGNRVEKIDQDHFFDLSMISNGSAYEDDRIMASRPKYRTVPFTVEYEYEIEFDGIIDFPDFYPVREYGVSSEASNLTVTVPDSIGLRYYESQLTVPAVISKDEDLVKYSWTFRTIPVMKEELFGPKMEDVFPAVLLAPGNFKVKGRWGTSDSWKSLGAFYYELFKDRDQLSIETARQVRDMTSTTADTLEKIRILYKYMQGRTRYVSIQVSLGSWQPTPADEVDKVGYGDCKALTNYMKALLKCAGIESYPSLIKAGTEKTDIIPSFPSQQFNHVILCIPLKKDTVWLECTSDEFPAGYTSDFTNGRTVLMLKESGGFLARTPLYGSETYHQDRNATIRIDGKKGMATVVTEHWGKFYEKYMVIARLDHTKKKDELIKTIPVANFVIDSFEIKEDVQERPLIKEFLKMSVNNMLIPAGDAFLLLPGQLSASFEIPGQIGNRQKQVCVNESTMQTDTIRYILPEGYTWSGNIRLNFVTPFGEYSSSATPVGNDLLYVRKLKINSGKWPVAQYEDFLNFYEKVNSADNKKVTIRKSVSSVQSSQPVSQ